AVIKPRKDVWINLGALREFPEKQTRLVNFKLPKGERWNGESDQTSAYVRSLPRANPTATPTPEDFQVFAINCAHLGCPVEWFPQAGLFMCPCHGGVYYEDGNRASGPPPRGLFEYLVKIEDGSLWIKGGHLPTLHDTLTHPARGT